MEADVDGYRYVTTYTRGLEQKPRHFLKNHNLYQKKNLSDSLPDSEICFHISESIFAISEVSFHVVWGWALAYLLFFSLNTVTKFIFTKKVDGCF